MVEQQNPDLPFNACSARLRKAIIDLRQYTEFAFGRLDARLSRVERQIGEEVVPAIARLEGGLARFERKLDGFIETQTKTNELVERRLLRLERGGAE